MESKRKPLGGGLGLGAICRKRGKKTIQIPIGPLVFSTCLHSSEDEGNPNNLRVFDRKLWIAEP